MRKYGKLLFILAVLAAVPAVASADGLLGGQRQSTPAGAQAQKQRNQQKAEQVAEALRSARIDGYDIEIEVKGDLVRLGGKVRDSGHRELAAAACQAVAGISRVENDLVYVPERETATTTRRTLREKVQAATIGSTPRPSPPVQQAEFGVPAQRAAPPVSNQQMAQQIAGALSNVGLTGYDIEIRYQNGVVVLGGSVATAEQRAAATAAASRIPGIRDVQNQLTVSGPIAQTSHAKPVYQQAMPAGYPQQAMPAGYPRQIMPASMATSAGMTHGPGSTAYSNPHLPSHAWPAYAQYPNSAAVTYPTQYSASAFPYIGPFYPYPQVPLDWREARLEWDDGFWHLNFNEKKDAWHWLYSPKNW